MNICPSCKTKHNKKHIMTNYDKIHYLCNRHEDENFLTYCTECNQNLCILCEEDHFEHNKISLGDMAYDKKDLLMVLNELKNSINEYEENNNKIIEVLNAVKEYLNNYYKLEEHLIHNYNQKELNYEILYNIEKMINHNNIIINDINQINSENDIQNKFNYINNIYNKYNPNEIKLKVRVQKHHVYKRFYFLDNTDSNEIVVGFKENENSENA